MARHALQAGDLQGLLTPSRSRGRHVELAQARALADASPLALEALEALEERAHGQAAALCSASISCAKALRWREALQLLTGKQDFSGERLVGSVVTLAVNCALNACAKKKQWQQALALLSSHRWVDTTSFNTAIAAVAKGGRWPLALALLWEMPRQQIRQDTFSFNSLFSGSRQRSWLISLALLEEMEVCPDAVTYNSALKSSGGRHSAMLLRRMRQQEVAPTAITFNTAISFCTSLSDAMALMEEMGSHSLQPTVVSLNSCIKVAEDWQQALEVLEQLEGRHLTSDVITFNSLLAHRPPNLQRVHAAMRTRRIQPDVVTWSSSISATGNWEEALACLTEASGDVDVAVLNAAISACGEASQWERALLLLFSHDEYGLTPDVVGFNAAMAACDQGQQWELALALLKALRDKKLQPSIISVSSVASACECAKHWPCAMELLLLMAQVGLERDDVAFNTVMSAATNGQQWERALGVLQLRAFEMALSVVSCNAAISALAAGAQAEDAQEFLGRMKTLQLEPTSITWNSLMSASASARHWRSALAMLSHFKASLVRCEVLTFCKAVEALQGEAKLLLPQLQELRDAVLLTT